MSAYLTNIVKTYKNSFKLNSDVPLLGVKEIRLWEIELLNDGVCFKSQVFSNKKPLKVLKMFEEVESAGTDVSFMCACCRRCSDCKNGERIEYISIQEEVEQVIINKSMTIDLERGYTSAKLLFLCDPTQKLAPNKHIAKKIHDGQVRKLSSNLNDKKEVIRSESKLHDLGFVEFLENLTIEQQ